MSAQRPALPNEPSVCPRCGAGFRCGMLAGDVACWCADLPLLADLPVRLADPAILSEKDAPAASCFCPACLKSLTAPTEPQSLA